MNPAIATKALNYVAVSSQLVKRALDEVQVHRAAQQKAAAMRGNVLALMLKTGSVAEHQKDAAEAMLGSHAETMGLLKTAIEKLATLKGQLQKQAADLGQGVDEHDVGGAQQAGYDSLEDGYVGRKTSQKKASDEAILKVLGPPG